MAQHEAEAEQTQEQEHQAAAEENSAGNATVDETAAGNPEAQSEAQASSEPAESSSPQEQEQAQAPQGEVVAEPTLRVLSGLHAGAEVVLADTDAVIGSDDACDIVLADPSVAARHARVSHQQGTYTLSPIENQTVRVGGTPLKDAYGLQQGSVISLGQVHVAFGTLKTAWHELALPEGNDSKDSQDIADTMHAQGAHAGKEHNPEAQDKTQDTAQPEAIQGEVIAPSTRHRKKHRRIATIVLPSVALAASMSLALWVFDDGTEMPDVASVMADLETYSIFTREGEDTPAEVLARHSPDSITPTKTDKRSLKALVEEALAKSSHYRGHFQVQGNGARQQGQPATVTVEGYVRSHSALGTLKHFIEAAVPQDKGTVRYKVTITSTLAMAIRADLESRGFHTISVRDKGHGNFVAEGLVVTKVRLRQALQGIALSLPRLQAIHDKVTTLDEIVRHIQAQLDSAGLSLRVMVPSRSQEDATATGQNKQDELEEHENTVSVSGLVNKADYKKWQQIATNVTQMYKPWLSLDDQVVNVRGFSLDVLSAVHGPHSFITVRHPRSGQNQDYAIGSVLPNGFRLVDVGSDHLVLTWQGRTYTYVLGEDHDTRTTDIRP